MAKNFRKYFFNNLKETVYLAHINRVEIDRTKTDANNELSDREVKNRRKQLDEIQIDDRHNNMRIYMKNMIDFRLGQTFVFAIPAALAIGTVASFVLPYKRVDSKKFSDVIVKESTVISNTDGEIYDNSQKYYYSSGFFDIGDYDFCDENDHNYASGSDYDSLVYQISNGMESIIAKFAYNSEGKLTFKGVDIGDFIDVKDYDFSESTNIEEKYSKLFDEVIELVKAEESLSAEQLEILNSLANSEEKKILIEIVKYNNIGEGHTDIYKTRFAQRLILLLISFFYLWFLYAVFKDGDLDKGTELYADDGVLHYNKDVRIGIFHVILKYKEAFIQAEKQRIKKLMI